jgi:hypothetical protein
VDDTVSIFVDNDPGQMNDDIWIEGVITGTDSSTGCVTQRVRVSDMTPLTPALSSIPVGAPVRSLTTLEYGLLQRDGEWYLGRGVPGGNLDPLVGPLRAEDGVLFEPLNSAGQPATNSSFLDVAQIRVTLRTASEIRDSQGNLVRDSLVSTIYTRN